MNGWVGLQSLRLPCHLGVTDQERAAPQEVVVSVALQLHLFPNDTLEATVDYQTIAQKLASAAAAKQYHLIETLAQVLLKVILDDSRICKVRLRVEKPNALENAACSFVELCA